MAVEFQMPKLGLTMEEGTITAWLVDSGTEVTAGTAVLSIETDKVESDVEASHSGILHITGAVGDLFACGERIGWFLEAGEEPPEGTGAGPLPTGSAGAPTVVDRTVIRPPGGDRAPGEPAARSGGRLFASPNARRVAAELGVELDTVVGTGPGGRIVSEDVEAAGAGIPGARRHPTQDAAHTGAGRGTGVAATPAARQAAARLGVDLGDVHPGRADRLDRSDVEMHVRDRLAGVQAAPTPPEIPEAPLLQEPTGRVPLSGMRGTIARRMHESLSQMAQLTLNMDVSMGAVVAHRRAAQGHRPGFTDYVVAAAAQALRQHPIVNSQVAQGAVNLLPEINVGLAVAIDGGLVVPVVHGADRLGFDELCAETTRLSGAARSGELALADLEGGTFSVTALGMYGVDAFTPVINPPNTAVLGVGRLRDSFRLDEGVPVPDKVLTLSLTWDHRAYDGAPAAEFAATVRDLLENWEAG